MLNIFMCMTMFSIHYNVFSSPAALVLEKGEKKFQETPSILDMEMFHLLCAALSVSTCSLL